MIMNKALVFSLIFLPTLFACKKGDGDIGSYKLKIKSEVCDTDSVTVRIFDSDYNALRTLNAGKLNRGELVLSGEMQGRAIAFLDYGKKEPVTFILQQCDTEITLGKDFCIVWGGKLNHDYQQKCKKIYTLDRELKNVENAYRKAVADSSLNKTAEQRLLRRHNSLAKSLQSAIVECVKSGGEVGKLIKEKFINRLDSANLKSLSDF